GEPDGLESLAKHSERLRNRNVICLGARVDRVHVADDVLNARGVGVGGRAGMRGPEIDDVGALWPQLEAIRLAERGIDGRQLVEAYELAIERSAAIQIFHARADLEVRRLAADHELTPLAVRIGHHRAAMTCRTLKLRRRVAVRRERLRDGSFVCIEI